MFFNIILTGLIYLLLIFLLHNLYLFFEKNLTTTKTKDLFNIPANEYKKIDKILNTNVENKNDDNDNVNINLNHKINDESMKHELNDFLQKLNIN